MAALQKMKPRDRGTIVQVGSALAYRGIPLQTAYCGAKHAIQGFHEALRCELLHEKSNVHVTMVQMPAVNTPQFSWVLSRLPHHAQPVPPIYQPEVAARGVLYAADHPKRREYWVGASTAAHPGRQRHRPGPAGPLPRQDRVRRPADQAATAARTRRRTCGNRPTDPTARTSAPTASSTDKAKTTATAAVGLAPPRPARRRRQPLPPPGPRSCSAAVGDHVADNQAAAVPPAVGLRIWAAATATAGALIMLRPQAVSRLVSGTGSTPDAAVVRVLGGRQLLQGAAVLIRPAPALIIGALAVDVLHATSMVAAALIWPGYRRAALTSAAVAAASAVAGALVLRGRRGDRATPTEPDPDPTRFPPQVLRDYALLADGERGAVLGPRGDIVWMCAPRWDSDAVFTALLGGPGGYSSPRWTASSGAATTKRAA